MAASEVMESQDLVLSTGGDTENRIPYLLTPALKNFADIRILSSDRYVFRLNRAVLASMSEFLRDIILEQDDKNEAEQLLFITEVTSEDLRFILGFFLNGYLPRDISNDLNSSFMALGIDLTKFNLEIASNLPSVDDVVDAAADGGDFVPPIAGTLIDDEAPPATYILPDQPPTPSRRAVKKEKTWWEDVENLPAKRRRTPTVKGRGRGRPRKRGRPPTRPDKMVYRPRAGFEADDLGYRASKRQKRETALGSDYVKMEPFDDDAVDDEQDIIDEEGSGEDFDPDHEDPDDDSDVDGTKDPNRKKECKICKVQFELPRYKMHMQKHRRNKAFKSKYVCQICKKRFTTKAGKNEHIETEHAQMQYTCEFCAKVYSAIQYAEYCKHIFIHKKKRGTQCVACGNIYKKVQGLDVHMKNSGKYHDNACVRCKDTVRFDTWSQHAEHVKSEHGDRWHYKCGHCALIFEDEQVYKDHVRDQHPHEKEICTICGGAYVQMFYHMKEKHSGEAERQLCPHCGKVCKSKVSLTHHIYFAHKSFPCEHCGKPQRTPKMYQNHIISMHTPEEMKPYRCQYCKKGFARSHQLKEHENIHTNLKPHKCKYCDARFNQQTNRAAHEKTIHMGIKRDKTRRRREAINATAMAAVIKVDQVAYVTTAT